MKKKQDTKIWFTPFEPVLDLLLLLFETNDLSFPCFFTPPVTTSKIVGISFIIVKSRFLDHESNSKSK